MVCKHCHEPIKLQGFTWYSEAIYGPRGALKNSPGSCRLSWSGYHEPKDERADLDPHGKPWATAEEIDAARPATDWNP
jgi:hypothetical protein